MITRFLKCSETYPTHILYASTDAFGDQVIKINYENKDGTVKCIWIERNHEGNHRQITEDFINYLKNNKIITNNNGAK